MKGKGERGGKRNGGSKDWSFGKCCKKGRKQHAEEEKIK